MVPEPLRYTAVRYQDASEQEHGLAGWSQSYCQLRPGSYDGEVETLALSQVTVSRETINVAVQERTAPPPGRVVFVTSPTGIGGWRMNAAPVSAAAVAVIRGGDEQVAAMEGGSDFLVVSVEADRLGAGGDRLPSAVSTTTTGSFDFYSGWFLSLLATCRAGGLKVDGEFAAVLPGLIIDRLHYVHQSICRRADLTVLGRPADRSLFARARAIANNDEDGTLTVAELAARVGVPTEVLREAFMRMVGVGPGTWLRSRRLDGARRDLLAAGRSGRTVTEIAATWGFWHLGRFAATYAAFFGETPSATVRAAGGQARSAADPSVTGSSAVSSSIGTMTGPRMR